MVIGDSPDGTSSRAVVVRHLRVRVRVDIVYSSFYFVLLCRTEVWLWLVRSSQVQQRTASRSDGFKW